MLPSSNCLGKDIYRYIYIHMHVSMYIFKPTNSILHTWFLCRQKTTVCSHRSRAVLSGTGRLEVSCCTLSSSDSQCTLHFKQALRHSCWSRHPSCSTRCPSPSWNLTNRSRWCWANDAQWALPTAQGAGWATGCRGSPRPCLTPVRVCQVPRFTRAHQHFTS